MEKCFLCQKLIQKDEYLSHVKQHELKQAGRKRTASSEEPSEEDRALPGKMGTSRMEERFVRIRLKFIKRKTLHLNSNIGEIRRLNLGNRSVGTACSCLHYKCPGLTPLFISSVIKYYHINEGHMTFRVQLPG